LKMSAQNDMLQIDNQSIAARLAIISHNWSVTKAFTKVCD